MWKRFFTRYLVATGAIANVVGLVLVLYLAPSLLSKAYLAAFAVPPATWAEARSGLKTWTPYANSHLAKGQIWVDGLEVRSLEEAVSKLHAGSVLKIGEGVYSYPLVIKANNVRIIGHGHVTFDGATAEGKGTFLVKGNDTTIENIECRNVKVHDGNGACVRLEGKNLNLEHVYFHSAQQGMLTGSKPGHVSIRHSYFERLGHGGRAHGIYQGGGTLSIERSYVLGSKSQGHEVKSRATRTSISNSVIASLTGKDSRLIDISNGGVFLVTDSTLQQGPNSVNGDMIGFALEKNRHPQNALTIKRNTIILERNGPNRLLHSKAKGMPLDISGNIIVSHQETGFENNNMEYRSRHEAKLPAYPHVPEPKE